MTEQRWRGFGRVLATCAGSVAAGFLLARCGAEGTPAPQLDPSEQVPPSACKPVEEYMPEFFKLLRDPAQPLAGLRETVESLSSDEGTAARPNPIAGLLSSSVRGLKNFTKDPWEDTVTQCWPVTDETPLPSRPLCSVEAAPHTSCENRLCATRRALDFGVKDEAAAKALDDLRPLLGTLLGYISNRGPGADGKEHYEIIRVFNRTADPRAGDLCASENLIDVLDGVIVFFRPSAECGADCPGNKGLQILKALIADPALQDFLKSFENSQQGGTSSGREAFQKLGKVLGDAFAQMPNDEHYFEQIDDLLNKVVIPFFDKDPDKYGGLKKKTLDGIALVKRLLDPNRPGAFLVQLKKVVTCLNAKDPNGEVVGALYDLLSKPAGKGLDLNELVGALDKVQSLDRQGLLSGALHAVLASTRKDEQAMDNLRAVLWQMLTEENARQVMPVLQIMVDRGVITEFVTMLDNLLYGCKSGGTR